MPHAHDAQHLGADVPLFPPFYNLSVWQIRGQVRLGGCVSFCSPPAESFRVLLKGKSLGVYLVLFFL